MLHFKDQRENGERKLNAAGTQIENVFTGIHSFFTQWYLTLISLPVLTFIYFFSLSVVLHLLVSLLFPYGISFLLVFLQVMFHSH